LKHHTVGGFRSEGSGVIWDIILPYAYDHDTRLAAELTRSTLAVEFLPEWEAAVETDAPKATKIGRLTAEVEALEHHCLPAQVVPVNHDGGPHHRPTRPDLRATRRPDRPSDARCGKEVFMFEEVLFDV
jgi:hypothetical protein